MESDNVVNLHQPVKSFYKPDGTAILTGALDAVLFAEFEKLNNRYIDKLEEATKQAKLIDELIQENMRLSNRDNILVAEKETSQSFMRRWRVVAYFGFLSTLMMLFMPSIVRVIFH